MTDTQKSIIATHFAMPPEQRKGFPLPHACIHLGDELRTGAIAGLGLDPKRRWRLCNKGYVAAVCMCAGKRDEWCGPNCPGYETEKPS